MAGMLEHPNVESPSPKSMEEAEQAEGSEGQCLHLSPDPGRKEEGFSPLQ